MLTPTTDQFIYFPIYIIWFLINFKVALIIGGASGIGKSSARLFARHGAKVVIADIQDHPCRNVCNDIGNHNVVSYVPCDVTKDLDVENAVNTVVLKHGQLDIMFSNAGISGNSSPSVLDMSHEEFKRVFNVNVYGAMLCARHAAKFMIPEEKMKHCLYFEHRLRNLRRCPARVLDVQGGGCWTD